MNLNSKLTASGLAAAALLIGATGAVAAAGTASGEAATTSAASSQCCGGYGDDAPYYLVIDHELTPSVGSDGATVEGQVNAGVHESESDREVVGADVPIDKTGVGLGNIIVDPDVDPAGIPIFTVPGDAVCVGAVCAPGRDVTVGAPTASFRAGAEGEVATVHADGASIGVSNLEACVDVFNGCQDTGDTNVTDGAAVTAPSVSAN